MDLHEKFVGAMAQLSLTAQRATRQTSRYARALMRWERRFNLDRECARRRRQIARGGLKQQSRGI